MKIKICFIVLALVGFAFTLSAIVYPRVCVCSINTSLLWCFKCRHFASACPRYWPRNSFGYLVPRFQPSCLVSRSASPKCSIQSCITCNVEKVSK